MSPPVVPPPSQPSRVFHLELVLNRLTMSGTFGQFVLAAACVRKDLRTERSLGLVFDGKVEPLDEKFWLELKAEVRSFV